MKILPERSEIEDFLYRWGIPKPKDAAEALITQAKEIDIDKLVWLWLDKCKVEGGYQLNQSFSDFIKEKIGK